MNKIAFISYLLFALFLTTQAQEESNVSVGLSSDLSTVLSDARDNDPTYQATKLRLEVDLEALPEARSFLFPQLSANVTGNEIDESFFAPELPFRVQGDASYDAHSYGLQLRQVIFNPALFSQVRRAHLEVEIANAGLEIANQDLLLRAAQGYFEVLIASNNLDQAAANLRASEEQYRQIQSRFEVGLATRAEHQQALARWQTAIADDIVARNNMQNIERILETITGTRYSNLADLPADTDVSTVLADIDRTDWIQSIEQNNLSLYQQQLRLEVAGRSVDIEKAGHYPTLEAVVNHGTQVRDGSIPGPGSRSQSTDASLQLSIPIFSGGRVRSRVRSANFEFEAVRQDLSNVRSEVIRQGEALLDQVSSQKQTVDALARAVEANELALEAKQEGFAVGIETNLNVLNAQRDLFQASLDYNRVRYDTLILRLQLEQAAGSLNDTHLGQLNTMLVPDQ